MWPSCYVIPFSLFLLSPLLILLRGDQRQEMQLRLFQWTSQRVRAPSDTKAANIIRSTKHDRSDANSNLSSAYCCACVPVSSKYQICFVFVSPHAKHRSTSTRYHSARALAQVAGLMFHPKWFRHNEIFSSLNPARKGTGNTPSRSCGEFARSTPKHGVWKFSFDIFLVPEALHSRACSVCILSTYRC